MFQYEFMPVEDYFDNDLGMMTIVIATDKAMKFYRLDETFIH